MQTIQNIVSKFRGSEATWDEHMNFCFETETHRGKTFFLGAQESPGEWRLVRYYGQIGDCAVEIGTYPTKGECKGAARKRAL